MTRMNCMILITPGKQEVENGTSSKWALGVKVLYSKLLCYKTKLPGGQTPESLTRGSDIPFNW